MLPAGDGGPDRDRTDDLLDANQALSQLSYGPQIPLCPGTLVKDFRAPLKTGWELLTGSVDLCAIPKDGAP